MSAWDITGALVWGFFAWTGWHEYRTSLPSDLKGPGLLVLVPITFGAIFCIARLLGARA